MRPTFVKVHFGSHRECFPFGTYWSIAILERKDDSEYVSQPVWLMNIHLRKCIFEDRQEGRHAVRPLLCKVPWFAGSEMFLTVEQARSLWRNGSEQIFSQPVWHYEYTRQRRCKFAIRRLTIEIVDTNKRGIRISTEGGPPLWWTAKRM